MKKPTEKKRNKGKEKRQSKLTFGIDGTVKIHEPQREIHVNCEQVDNENIIKNNRKTKHSRGTFGLFYRNHYTYDNVCRERRGLNYLIYTG